MRRKREAARVEDFVQVAERLRPYVTASPAGDDSSPESPSAPDPVVLDELMQRVVTLLVVMPRNQRRETIEELVSPHDPGRAQRAVDALIEAEIVTEDDTGVLRRAS